MPDTNLTLKVTDANALADRLFGRASSQLSVEPVSTRRDMKLAARLIWWLLRDLPPSEVITLPDNN